MGNHHAQPGDLMTGPVAASSTELLADESLADAASIGVVQEEDQRKRRKPSFFVRLIGVVGELLLTAGVVLGLFIVWQLWWTNFIGGEHQRQQVVQAQEQFEAVPTKIGEPRFTDPPEYGAQPYGGTYGVIHIPAFGYDHASVIQEGVGTDVLDQGSFGHYEETAYPGQIGNFSMAVHREIYGARMLHVDELLEGDAIVVEMEDSWLVYKIVDLEIVLPTDVYVIAPDPFKAKEPFKQNGMIPGEAPTRRLLTITTCHPPMVSDHRYIVHAEFDHWVAREDGMPEELVPPEDRGDFAAGLPAGETPGALASGVTVAGQLEGVREF
ncbi:MAG: class E sortase [Actinomycetaceae bacterium]|nr:class E sortase [Arcanobacterium sp.]MDD7505117.1 class E sortase [Actinomycetaceae bacterium]